MLQVVSFLLSQCLLHFVHSFIRMSSISICLRKCRFAFVNFAVDFKYFCSKCEFCWWCLGCFKLCQMFRFRMTLFLLMFLVSVKLFTTILFVPPSFWYLIYGWTTSTTTILRSALVKYVWFLTNRALPTSFFSTSPLVTIFMQETNSFEVEKSWTSEEWPINNFLVP